MTLSFKTPEAKLAWRVKVIQLEIEHYESMLKVWQKELVVAKSELEQFEASKDEQNATKVS